MTTMHSNEAKGKRKEMSVGKTGQKIWLILKKCFIRKLQGVMVMTVSSLLLVGISQAAILGPNFPGVKHVLDEQMQVEIMNTELTQSEIPLSEVVTIWRTANRLSSNGDISGVHGLRDPFAPLKRPTPESKKSAIPRMPKSSPVLTPLPGKLLSVVNGPWGYLALIQISPSEHLMVGTGELVADTGWRVKEIHEDRVQLEFVNLPAHPKTPSQIPSTILFFE